jgi:hypothetical protein
LALVRVAGHVGTWSAGAVSAVSRFRNTQ